MSTDPTLLYPAPDASGPELPPSVPPGAGPMAILSLILGIVGVLGMLGSCCCCFSLPLGLCSPVAWFLGAREKGAIRDGTAPQAGQGMANAGMILGIVGSALLILYVIGIIIWGIVAGFSGVMQTLSRGTIH
jgi:hypothetical protein